MVMFSLAILVNISDFLVLGMWFLFDVSLITDEFHRLNTFNLQVIVRIKDLNLILGINKEILINFFLDVIFIIFHKINLLHLHTSIIIPYLLEDIRRLSLKYPNARGVFPHDAVLNLNHGKHILDDEANIAIVWPIHFDMIDDLDLSVAFLILLVQVSLLEGVHDLQVFFAEVSV